MLVLSSSLYQQTDLFCNYINAPKKFKKSCVNLGGAQKKTPKVETWIIIMCKEQTALLCWWATTQTEEGRAVYPSQPRSRMKGHKAREDTGTLSPNSTDKNHSSSRKAQNIHVVERRSNKNNVRVYNKTRFPATSDSLMLRKHRVLERWRGPGRERNTAGTNLELWCKGNMSKQSGCRIFVLFEGSVKEHCLWLQPKHERNLSGHRDLRLVAKTQWGHIYSKMGRGTPYVRA